MVVTEATIQWMVMAIVLLAALNMLTLYSLVRMVFHGQGLFERKEVTDAHPTRLYSAKQDR